MTFYLKIYIQHTEITGGLTMQGRRDPITEKWMLDDGTEMTFFDWNVAQNQPNIGVNEHFIYLRVQRQCKWNDIGSTARPFICELQL